MKQPVKFLGKHNLTQCYMWEVVIQNAETAYTIEATVRNVKMLYSTYSQADIYGVSENSVQIDANQPKNFLYLIKEFQDLFDGNMDKWDTSTINLQLDLGSKPFNDIYYTVPRINKETLHTELL